MLGMPDMSYGWAKLTGEYLAKLAYEKYGINSAIYRPFSGYGEDQDKAYPFPAICVRAIEWVKNANFTKGVLRTEPYKPFQVWGSGNQIRDFIHIDDIVEGVTMTMDKLHNAEALNLSTGKGTSFKEFAKIALNSMGYDPEIVGTSDKPEGVFYRVGDIRKQENLGFKPKISFETGVKRMIERLK